MEHPAQPQNDPATSLALSPSPATRPVSLIQRIAFWSVFPAVLAVPIFFAFGRILFGAGGWMIFMTMFGGLLILLPYHIILIVLALVGRRSYLSVIVTVLLMSYYLTIFVSQLTLVDGGDTDSSIGSVLTFMGLPSAINDSVFSVSMSVGVLLMIAVVIFQIISIVDTRKKKKAEQSTASQPTV